VKRSCLLSLLLFASLFGAAFYYFHGRFFPPADWIGALVFAFFTSMGIGSIRNAFHESGDAGLLQRADGPREDGERIAVTGPIQPIGEPLRAPLSGSPCVAYEYEMFHYGRTDGRTEKVKDRTGLALTPSVIRTTHGDVKLLGFPMLENFRATSNPHWRENAAVYLENTNFEEVQLTKVFSMVRELLTDDDGALRKDWKLSAAADVSGLELEEKILPAGEMVTVVGQYSAAKNGVVQNLGQGGLRILRGDRDAAAAAFRGGRTRAFVFAVFLLTIPNIILWFVLGRREHYNTEHGSGSIAVVQKQTLFEAVAKGDVAAVTNYLAHGGNVDLTDDEGKTALMRVSNADVARKLLEANANVDATDTHGMTPLMCAATNGNTDVVRLLIARRARLDDQDSEYHRTALQYAFDNDHADIVSILHDAGAHDEMVTAGNGKALPSDGGEPFAAVAGYFKAIQTGDATTVKPFVKKANQHYWDEKSLTWKEIQGAHPADPDFVSGFEGDGKAAVTVKGKTADGLVETWIVQLTSEDQPWRVADEHWVVPSR